MRRNNQIIPNTKATLTKVFVDQIFRISSLTFIGIVSLTPNPGLVN